MSKVATHPKAPGAANDAAVVPPGYKRTELGVIPEEWDVSPFGEFVQIVMGQSPPGSTYNTNGHGTPLINGPTEFTDKHPIKIQWTTEPTRLCERYDVLLCVRGSSTGRINIADGSYCIGRGVAAVRATTRSVDVLIPYLVEEAVDKLLSLSTGSTFPSIDKKAIGSIPTPLPGVPEQRAIAAALSDVDTLIGALDKLIAKKRDLKQAAKQQILTGRTRLPGFGKKGLSYKQSDVGVIPEDWRAVKIKDYASIKTGKRNTQDRVEDGEYPFFVRSQVVERINSYSFDGEAVLTAGDGVGTGKVFHYINGRFDFHQRVYKISDFSPDLNGFFCFLVFSSRFYDRIMSMTAKSSVDSVRLEMIADMQIPLPPTVDEQRAIAGVLLDMDAELAALEQRRDKTRALKQGMMQELLTGRTRLV